jgi:rRNA maturation protein Nop10
LNESAIPEALACPSCGGRLEAAAKVYFDLTAAERRADGELAVTGIEIAELNDSFDGHPAALESELVVSCKECGERSEFGLAGAALARAQFHRALPADSEPLLAAASAIYHGARDGQAAVEAWARGPWVAPHVACRRCEPCEASTPHIADTCAVCGSASVAEVRR